MNQDAAFLLNIALYVGVCDAMNSMERLTVV